MQIPQPVYVPSLHFLAQELICLLESEFKVSRRRVGIFNKRSNFVEEARVLGKRVLQFPYNRDGSQGAFLFSFPLKGECLEVPVLLSLGVEVKFKDFHEDYCMI